MNSQISYTNHPTVPEMALEQQCATQPAAAAPTIMTL
jgi:hypothetical protein